MSYGEGVVDKDTMKKLSAALNSGTFGQTVVNVFIGKEKLNSLVDKVVTVRQKQGVIGRAYI
jgi:hypothetical protein